MGLWDFQGVYFRKKTTLTRCFTGESWDDKEKGNVSLVTDFVGKSIFIEKFFANNS